MSATFDDSTAYVNYKNPSESKVYEMALAFVSVWEELVKKNGEMTLNKQEIAEFVTMVSLQILTKADIDQVAIHFNNLKLCTQITRITEEN